jgi:hypothetical protein
MLWIPEPPELFTANPLDRKINWDSTQAKNLIGFWPMDEARPDTARDYSKGGNHGALALSPTGVSTVRGRGQYFNGTSQYMDIPVAAFAGLSRGSICLSALLFGSARKSLVSFSNGAGSFNVGALEWNCDATDSFSIYAYPDGSTATVYSGYTASVYPTGNLYKLAWTGGPDGSRLYVNGAPQILSYLAGNFGVANWFSSITGGVDKIRVANRRVGNANQLHAEAIIMDLRFYSEQLSPARVSDMFRNPQDIWAADDIYLYTNPSRPYLARRQPFNWMNGCG